MCPRCCVYRQYSTYVATVVEPGETVVPRSHGLNLTSMTSEVNGSNVITGLVAPSKLVCCVLILYLISYNTRPTFPIETEYTNVGYSDQQRPKLHLCR
jgi:hypothetical protein